MRSMHNFATENFSKRLLTDDWWTNILGKTISFWVWDERFERFNYHSIVYVFGDWENEWYNSIDRWINSSRCLFYHHSNISTNWKLKYAPKWNVFGSSDVSVVLLLQPINRRDFIITMSQNNVLFGATLSTLGGALSL